MIKVLLIDDTPAALDLDGLATDAWIEALAGLGPYGPCPCGCGAKLKFARQQGLARHEEAFKAQWLSRHPDTIGPDLT